MPLLEWRRPSDVAGFVIPGGIDAVDRHSGGAIADFFQDFFCEDCEIIKPTGDHYGAFATPVFKAWLVGVCSSFFDRLPRIVEWRARSLRRISVLSRVRVSEFGARPTTGRVSASEPSDADDSLLPAVASAEPMRAAFFHVMKADGDETSELLSRNIEFTHDGSLLELLCQSRRFQRRKRRLAYFTTHLRNGGGGLPCRSGPPPLGSPPSVESYFHRCNQRAAGKLTDFHIVPQARRGNG